MEIAEEIDILKTIGCLKNAWKLVSETTMKNCFEKCGLPKVSEEIIY